MNTDLLRDAWPWVLLAFLLGLLAGWLVTWVYYRKRVAALAAELDECRSSSQAAPLLASASPVKEFSGEELQRASRIIGRKVRLDDLRLVEGIGPKIEGLMNADGIDTWHELAGAQTSRLQAILDAAGPRYRMHDPGTWSRQARLLSKGEWETFKKLTDELDGGR